MILNIQTLKSKVDEMITFDEMVDISVQSLKLTTTVHDYKGRVYGKVAREGDLFIAEGYVDLDLILLCDRCMVEVTSPMHAPLYCEFSTDEKYLEEDCDVKQVTKSSIDLSDAILEAIAMNLPMKVLCKEDCQGMCKGCGTNLNKSTCKCEALDIDPRLEQLKNIFG
ncbi:MAG: YceD family protein [Cellulosilyticaceae bacterium]